MRAMVAAAIVLALTATTTQGTLVLLSSVTTSPSAIRPVTLAAGTTGTTTLGSSATSATTTGGTLSAITAATNLKVVHGSVAWQVQLRVTAASGLVGGLTPDTITLGIVAGGTPQTVTLTSLTSLPVTTSALTLAAAGPDISITSLGVCLGTCPLTLQILFVPSGQTSPAFTYNYSLSVT